MNLPSQHVLRLASVSFLNARPLIHGLDRDLALRLLLDVPSKLVDHLGSGSCDVALLPTIDYQRLPDLCVVPSGGIGSDGETLTVRIFARTPIERIKTLACDPDSHTSVALARIILAERHGVRPEFIGLSRASERLDEARLLIGDKVVCEEPRGFQHQYDLGAEWKELTGLPFVFAVWTARQGLDLGDLPSRLERAKREGLKHVEQLVEQFARPIGWPSQLALQYMTEHLQYDVGQRELGAIGLFHELAARHGLIDKPKPLCVYEPVSRR